MRLSLSPFSSLFPPEVMHYISHLWRYYGQAALWPVHIGVF